MRLASFLPAVVAPALLASSTLVREVYEPHSFANEPVPAFDKGYLLAIAQGSAAVDLYDPAGHFFLHLMAQAPEGGSNLHVSDAAIDVDGTIAVSASYTSGVGRASGLLFFDRGGKQIRFIDTGRYVPLHVCFAPDHSVWTLGWQRDAYHADHADEQDYFLVHKYSWEGKELGAYIRRSGYAKPGLEPGTGHGGGWTIRTAKDRTGAFLFPGMVSDDAVWIELDFKGNLLGSWHTGKPSSGGYAFTESARLFRTRIVAPDGPKTVKIFLDELDRATSVWKTVESYDDPSTNYGWLLGADGENLVFNKDAGMRIFWVSAPSR